MNEVTQILSQIESGDRSAAEQLLPLVYEELRQLAAQMLSHERPGHSLQPTALVHEAYLRLVDEPQSRRWDSRRHFFAAAAEAMRRILIDSARRKHRVKHGADLGQVDLKDADAVASLPPLDELLALDEALDELAAHDPVKADLVKLRYFAGLSQQEAAEMLNISRATAARYWTYARVWLFDRIHSEDET